MSFWPLPTNLAELLREARRRGPIVEVGGGAGSFVECLGRLGLDAVLLDLMPQPTIGTLAVAGDWSSLPFVRGSLGAAVWANAVRHVSRHDGPDVAEQVWDALSPGGVVVVLEDHPDAQTIAQQNYREVLTLLAGRDPSRGAAVGPQWLRGWADRWGEPVLEAELPNTWSIQDALEPLRWLRARAESGDTVELDRLERRVQSHGMEYGDYWMRAYKKPRGDATL